MASGPRWPRAAVGAVIVRWEERALREVSWLRFHWLRFVTWLYDICSTKERGDLRELEGKGSDLTPLKGAFVTQHVDC